MNPGHEKYLTYEEKSEEAQRLGLEVVPRLHYGPMVSSDEVLRLLEKVSVLGGAKIEGVVIKNTAKFGEDGKALMGKYVSEAFKEKHGGEWRKNNPTTGDMVQMIGDDYRTPARWEKAVQHLKERGEWTGSPKDIGPLMKEVNKDVLAECAGEIKEKLFDYAWKHVSRKIVAGLPEWYKQELLKAQFGEGTK